MIFVEENKKSLNLSDINLIPENKDKKKKLVEINIELKYEDLPFENENNILKNKNKQTLENFNYQDNGMILKVYFYVLEVL